MLYAMSLSDLALGLRGCSEMGCELRCLQCMCMPQISLQSCSQGHLSFNIIAITSHCITLHPAAVSSSVTLPAAASCLGDLQLQCGVQHEQSPTCSENRQQPKTTHATIAESCLGMHT